MRELKFATKTTHTIKTTMTAIAWATNRRGRNAWKDDVGVSDVIAKYLDDHNVKMPEEHKDHTAGSRITYTLKRIANEGLGRIEQNSHGRIVYFKFDDDVNITGFTPEFLVKERPPVPVAQYDQAGSEGFKPDPMSMPLPPGPKPTRFLGEEVEKGLDKWAENDPDGYAKWAETLLERLGALYG